MGVHVCGTHQDMSESANKRTIDEANLGDDKSDTSTKKSALSAFSTYFNQKYRDPAVQKELKEKLFSAKPFPHLQIQDFIQDPEFIHDLELEVPQRQFVLKSNDLYDFYQSGDLTKCEDSPCIHRFHELMTDNHLHQWLTEITDVEGIASAIDMSAAIYQDGSYLQCHDDKLEGRRIAYIYYLVDEKWSEKDGGELSLFEPAQVGVPKSLPSVKIVPKRNSLFIFLVSVNSFHRVEQLLTAKGRMTISGWFHGPPKAYPPVESPPDPYVMTPFPAPTDSDNDLLEAWINPIYLQQDSQEQIQEQFETDSQISLQCFLKDDKFKELRTFVTAKSDEEWTLESPPHQRSFLSRKFDRQEDTVLGHFSKLITSAPFIQLMKKMTDLDLTEYFGEVQKFANGHFTLMHDSDSRRQREGLDCFFYLIDPTLEWDEGWGAYTSYNGEDGELLTVTPCGNTLSLVFCDKAISRFTKFVNYHVPCPMYSIYMLAYEDPSSEAGTEEQTEQ